MFELADTGPTRLTNISTRGFVGTDDDVLIGGVIIEGDKPLTVVIRVRGPSLANFGVHGALADPSVQLFSGQELIDSNDNWQDHGSASLIPGHLRPTEATESAVLCTLAPGAYTAIVRGVNNTTGIGIVEVFELE